MALSVLASSWAGAQGKQLDWDDPANQWDYLSELAPEQDTIEHLFANVDESGVDFTLRFDPVRGDLDRASLLDPDRDSLEEMLTENTGHAGIKGLFDFHNPNTANANDPDYTLNLGWNEPDRDDGLLTTFSFSQAVTELTFDTFDIDKLKWTGALGAEHTGESKGWIDRVTITGWLNGMPVAPEFTGIPRSATGSTPTNIYEAAGAPDPAQFVQIVGNTLEGRWEFNPTGDFGKLPHLLDWDTDQTYGGDGNVLGVRFPTPVDSVTIEHQNAWSEPGSNARSKPDAYWGGQELEISIGDIGFEVPELIRDRVWVDLDRDGMQDPGEPGLAGVDVQLLSSFSIPIESDGAPVIATSGPNGGYYLMPPNPGNYKLRVIPPAGFVPTATNAALDDADSDFFINFLTSTINIAPGEDERTVDAGFLPRAGAFCNIVFDDADADGIRGPHEAPLQGVVVTVRDSTGSSVIATATTNPDGIYYIDQLPAGDYVLEFTPPAGYAASTPGQGFDDRANSDIDPLTNRTGAITLGTEEIITTVGAGFHKLTSIGDQVFNDKDGDDKFDLDEIGLPGVTVILHDASGTNPLATTVSGPDGRYEFADLAPGTYVVEFVTPTGFATVEQDKDSDDSIDSDYDPVTGRTAPVILLPGIPVTNLDAGFKPPNKFAQIGDRVWNDLDENGIQDPGEDGLGGLTVALLHDDGSPVTDTGGNPVTTTTGPDGVYNFVAAPLATYRIAFPHDYALSLSPALAGADPALDSDPDPVTCVTGPIFVNEEELRHDVDAGFIKVIVGDTAWVDLDRDGLQDDSESGLAGVTVELLGLTGTPVLDSGGKAVTTVTDAAGNYALFGFGPGSYKVRFTAPAGYLPTLENAGGDDLRDSDIGATGMTGPIDMTAGTPNRSVDAGFLPLQGAVGDTVFDDQNFNGLHDPGEPGLAGVAVTLLDGSGSTVLATTTTDAGGHYYFDALPAADYVVEFGTPDRYGITIPNAGGDDTIDSDIAAGTGRTGPITVGTSASRPDIDAGFVELGSIGDLVFYDKNNDGKQHPVDDFGLPGVTVVLYDASGNNPLRSTFADADGIYRFDGLYPGGYVVEFVMPFGFKTVQKDNGDDDGLDSDYDELTLKTDLITLAPGEHAAHVDGGFEPPDRGGAIGDHVWEDVDCDGLQTPGEPGLGGVLVELLNADGTPFVDTGGHPVLTTSRPDGLFYFVVPEGIYALRMTPLDDMNFTTPQAGSDALLDSDVDPATRLTSVIVVENGWWRMDVDAGLRFAAVAGRLWSDNNNNWTQDYWELGLPNVTVYLDTNDNGSRDPGEPAVVTGLDGQYFLNNLLPGDYTLRVDPATVPAGANLTYDPDPTPDAAADLTLAAGELAEARDFGFMGGTGDISGFVRNDLDGDGDLADPDSGVAAIDVELYGDVDLDGDYSPGVDYYLATASTNSRGRFVFEGLLAGHYALRQVDPAGTTSTNDSDDNPLQPNGTDNSIGFNVWAGLDSPGHLFLDQRPGQNSIAGSVINDLNGNSANDNEPGIAAVQLDLVVDSNGNGLADEGLTSHATTHTDAAGNYEFSDIPPGNWVVVATEPAGATSTNDLNGSPTDNMSSVRLEATNESWFDVDFHDTGVTLRRIVGITFEDSDDNNTFTVGDTRAAAIPVDLYVDANGNLAPDPGETLVMSTFSDEAGQYEFTNLPPGQYIVVGPSDTPMKAETDSDGTTYNGKNEIAVALGTRDATGNNFLGDIRSISGQVREDLDVDGNLGDNDEPGIPGVTVRLYVDADLNQKFKADKDILLQTTTTNADGYYAFVGISSGNYIVVEEDPPGAISTNDGDAGLLSTGTDNWAFVSLGGNKKGVDFLDASVARSSIAGQARNDSNGDGNLAEAESGIGGLPISLFTDPNGDGNPADGALVTSTVTALDGTYEFADLNLGTYVVVATDPPGVTSTNDKDDAPLGLVGIDNRIAVSLGAAPSGGNDFLDTGLSPRTVRGRVYDDDDATDNNTIGPEDAGIGGVELLLHADPNGNGLVDPGDKLLGRTYSDTDGAYLFGNMLDGLYTVFQQDAPGAVSDHDIDGDPFDSSVGVSLNGGDLAGNDFLDDAGTSHGISGTVTNGTAPIAGVRIDLFVAGGIPVDSTFTGIDGAYHFPNLIPGTYEVMENNPGGTTGGNDTDGGDPDTITVSLTGADSGGHNFVDTGARVASIRGSVLEDGSANNDLIDAEDIAVGAVPVSLIVDLDGDGMAGTAEPSIGLAHTRTDGTFVFASLAEGSFLLREHNPANTTSDADSDGPANGNDLIAVTLSGGIDSADNHFLDEGMVPLSISGTVRNGSTPMAGVELRLRNQGGFLIDSVASNQDGEYIFPNIISGIFVIEEIDPPGTTGGSDFDGPHNGNNHITAVLATSPLTGRDFTDTTGAESLHAIEGRILKDVSGNGSTTDPDNRPIDGVPVSLFRDTDLDGQGRTLECVATKISDAQGRYRFANLPDGNYLLVQEPVAGTNSIPTGSSGPDNGDPSMTPVSLAGEDAPETVFTAIIDPAGYFYDTVTGEIINGGHIDVVPSGLGVPTITQSGINGQYSFVVDRAGTYTMVIIPPSGYILDSDRAVAGPSYDPTGQPDPDTLGSVENPSQPGHLVDASATANPYYLVFDLEPGDPLVLSNNIPFRLSASRSFSQFLIDENVPAGPDAQPVPDQSGNGGNPDRDHRSNLLEYALGEDPTTGASPNQGGFRLELTDQVAGRIDAVFTRNTSTIDLIYTIQTRDSLNATWNTLVTIPAGAEAPAPLIVTPNGDGTETVVYPDLIAGSVGTLTPALGLVRLTVDLDVDQNGTPDTLADGTPATDHTETFGWQGSNFNTAQTASFSHPFSNAPVFSGTIDYVLGATVNVASSSNNFDLSSIIGSGGSHYLQITSGPLAGHRFDIASAAVISLTLVNDPDIFSDSDGVNSLNTSSGLPADADLAGHGFMVIPHLTIDQLFDKNTAFAGQASGIPSRAAKLFFYHNRSDSPGLRSLLLVDLGTEQRWIRSNDFAQLTDQGGTPIDRCDGSYIYPGLGPVTNQFSIGMVADHAVAAAFNSGYNLAGSPFPLDQTPTGPNGRAMTVGNGFAGGINPTQSSELLFWTGDFAADQGASYVQGYDSYMQLDGGGMQRWIDVSDQQLNDIGPTLLLESHRAMTVKIPSGTRLEPHVYPVPTTP